LTSRHFAKSSLTGPRFAPALAYNCCMQPSDLVVVQAFGTQVEADLAKSMLQSAGIDAMIQADRAGGMRDHLAWSGFGFQVLVRREDAVTAREVLNPVHQVPEGKLVVAKVFGAQKDAEVAQDTLESAGIAAAIEAVPVGDKNPALSLVDPVFRVMVREEDAAAARDVLLQSL
jgi:hypothetical protein